MRFPFGRGARQREVDGLRQRIAELQGEITKLEETLIAESPDTETTDATDPFSFCESRCAGMRSQPCVGSSQGSSPDSRR